MSSCGCNSLISSHFSQGSEKALKPKLDQFKKRLIQRHKPKRSRDRARAKARYLLHAEFLVLGLGRSQSYSLQDEG